MIFLLVLAAPAHAERWWGVGPTLGTMGFPLAYPALMPALAQGSSGNNLVDPVAFDLRLGAHGVYYTGGGGRVGARLLLGVNFAAWGAQEATIEYEWILTKDEKFQAFAGGGIGFGHEAFGSSSSDVTKLDVTYFPLRAQAGVLWRDRTRAYEADVFGTWHLAGDQTFTTSKGVEKKGTAVADPFATDGTKSDAALYVAIGAEFTVYFGNFRNKGKGKKDND